MASDPLGAAVICHGNAPSSGQTDQTNGHRAHDGCCSVCSVLQTGAPVDVPQTAEIISVDRSTAAPATPRRSNFGATTSNGSSSSIAVAETGTVKWFNAEKGYGFIALNSGGKDVFVHASALERSGLTDLGEGQPVIVDVVEGRKGLEAARVRLI